MKLIRLIYLCIRLHSVSRARWVAAYENSSNHPTANEKPKTTPTEKHR